MPHRRRTRTVHSHSPEGANVRRHIIHASLNPSVSMPNGISIGSAGFAQLTAECRRAHWRHLANTIERVLPSPTRVNNPNGKPIGSAVFALLTTESPYL